MRTDSANGETINIGNDAEELEIAALAERILRTAAVTDEISPRYVSHDPLSAHAQIYRRRRLLGFKP
jgi:nucleoside-diphosphate-sugar epimerase